MNIVFIGTRAQLIKMAPVILCLEQQGDDFRLILTGQHQETMAELLAEFGIKTVPQVLYQGPDIVGIAQMARWFLRVLWRATVSQRRLMPTTQGQPRHCMLVHGDTFSTLLGALIARVRGYRLAHVEAGLTSGSWREPFPEELTRRLVFRLSDIAFCPGEWAVQNLAQLKLRAINTGHNTLLDAVRLALTQPCSPAQAPSDQDYAIASIHRFENIFDATRFERVISLLEKVAQRLPLLFVLHPATRKQATKLGLLQRLENNSAITLRARMTYVPFMQLVANSRLVLTDGGSNQEELAYLNKPTVIMRHATERPEGLGRNAILSDLDEGKTMDFVDQVLAAPVSETVFEKNIAGGAEPSAVIVQTLQGL